MAIPVSYNLRNLIVRKTTTIMTALGITLTVAVLLPLSGQPKLNWNVVTAPDGMVYVYAKEPIAPGLSEFWRVPVQELLPAIDGGGGLGVAPAGSQVPCAAAGGLVTREIELGSTLYTVTVMLRFSPGMLRPLL